MIIVIFHFLLNLVSDGDRIQTRCVYDETQPDSRYYYFLTTVYPPLELIVFLCLPLLINICCTIIIVRSLSIRMRTAKQFRPSKHPKKPIPEKSFSLMEYLLPKSSSKFSVFSCLCFQIRCRRHNRLRLTMGSTKQSLTKYYEENQILDRQKSILVTSSISDDHSGAINTSTATAAATAAAEAAARTSQILNKQHRTRRTRDIHLSAMLIGLNVFYLILNLPFNLYQTFAKHIYTQNSDPCDIMFIGVLLDALQQTFFSTNFFLYVLTNRRFREEFYNTFSKFVSNRRSSNHQIYQEATSSAGTATQRSRVRISSCNPSTVIPPGVPSNDYSGIRPSVASDFELHSNLPPETHNQQRVVSKLVAFKDLDHGNV